ncbi:hypothetical protein [Gracilibacillus alcaliphilus]|uniref:hypothetical protein n=1 Tax=Gracilibacillus alcaliphilus TaxID=1401441 RepID=UPI00195A7F0C|nr:hypothetical protein [Gracilibacillus alcaliphilus]MBM7675226.1 uncharacterized protein (UPF0335 family) [Gracilibacillus alcaliphilus]
MNHHFMYHKEVCQQKLDQLIQMFERIEHEWEARKQEMEYVKEDLTKKEGA